MREILFRGKNVDNGEWIKGTLSKSRNIYEKPALLKWCIDYEENGVMMFCIIDPETVGQFTGLTDKNGTKIFEGDIVKGVAYSTDFVGTIVWIDEIAGFGVRYFNKHREPTAWENSSILKAIQRFKMPNEFQAEVIGNIHDNPELLK